MEDRMILPEQTYAFRPLLPATPIPAGTALHTSDRSIRIRPVDGEFPRTPLWNLPCEFAPQHIPKPLATRTKPLARRTASPCIGSRVAIALVTGKGDLCDRTHPADARGARARNTKSSCGARARQSELDSRNIVAVS